MGKKSKKVAVAEQISLLVEAIKCSDAYAARLLVERAMNTCFENENDFSHEQAWDDKDLDAVITLIRGINPKDTTEAILSAQFVAFHLQGMATMAKDYLNSKGHGMMMIRLSHQALEMLQRYRGKNQTINVNYNVINKGKATLNTLIQSGDN